jgi:hypothetical protein
MKKSSWVEKIEIGFRRRRNGMLVELMSRLRRPLRVLDVGGEVAFWQTLELPAGSEIHVTLLNRFVPPACPPHFHAMLGDARDLSRWRPGDFDLVVSNSVIGHVGGWADQQKMAAEIRRLAAPYLVQTPNRWFPVDWRTLVPAFHFLPKPVRARLLHWLPLAPFGRLPSYESALAWCDEVRELDRAEFASLFPEAKLVSEKFLGFTKSYSAWYAP